MCDQIWTQNIAVKILGNISVVVFADSEPTSGVIHIFDVIPAHSVGPHQLSQCVECEPILSSLDNQSFGVCGVRRFAKAGDPVPTVVEYVNPITHVLHRRQIGVVVIGELPVVPAGDLGQLLVIIVGVVLDPYFTGAQMTHKCLGQD